MATEDALAENAALAGDFRADTRLTARGAVMPTEAMVKALML